jgi:large subunit ribosomal protein L21
MDYPPNFPGDLWKRTAHRVFGEVKIGGEEMKYAIIRSGGKQYKAVPGETIQVDKLPVDPGNKVVLNEVLFIADGVKKVTIGTPLIKGAKVETTVADQIKGPKIRVFKYKPKVRYRKRQGHRQKYTLLSVDKIISSSEKASSDKSTAKASEKTSSKKGTKTSTKASPKASSKASSKTAAKASKKASPKASASAKTSSKTKTKTSTKTSKKASSKGSAAKASKKAGDKDGS